MEGLKPPSPPVSRLVGRVSSPALPPTPSSSSSATPIPTGEIAISESAGSGGREWRKAEIGGEAREVAEAASGGGARGWWDGGDDTRRRGERGGEEEDERLRRGHQGGMVW